MLKLGVCQMRLALINRRTSGSQQWTRSRSASLEKLIKEHPREQGNSSDCRGAQSVLAPWATKTMP